MEISKNIVITDLALYLKKQNILILADTHIGYEEALNKQGVLIPRFQFNGIIQRLEKIINVLSKNSSSGGWGTLPNTSRTKGALSPQMKKGKVDDSYSNDKNKIFNKIIINGDIKHEFGTISEQEWRLTLRLLDFLGKYTNEIILIKGNHDTILGPIAKKRNIKLLDNYKIDDLLITHGHKIPGKPLLKGIKTVIIGHEHPAISIREGPRSELFKCFLKGKWKGKTLIVQPSLNLVTEGTNILKEKLLSPFLKQDLGNFEVFVVGEEVMGFGKINDIMK